MSVEVREEIVRAMYPDRPIRNGYYAMTVRDLVTMLGGLPDDREVRIEIDTRRFPVVKMLNESNALVLRVPEAKR